MKRLLLLYICLIFSGLCLAQEKEEIKDKSDSLRSENLANETERLKVLQQQFIQDSIKRAELEEQLKNLQNADNYKKQDLLQEIETLKSKEAKNLLEKKHRIDSLRTYEKGFPVVPFRDTLFYMYARAGAFSPGDRSIAIADKIKKLATDYIFVSDSVLIVPIDNTVDIVYRDMTIMSISETDALWENTTAGKLAHTYKNEIIDAVKKHKEETRLTTLVKEIALAIVVLLGLTIIIVLVNKLFRRLRTFLYTKKGTWFRGVKIRTYQLFTPIQQLNFIFLVSNIIKWILILLLTYMSLPALFSIFPQTKDISEKLLGFVVDPLLNILQNIWNYLPNLFTIIIIVFIFRWIIKGLAFLKSEVERGALVLDKFHPEWANPTFQIIRVIILAFMFIVIFPYLPGSESPIFRGVSVFLGFLVTFGSAGTLSNVVSGLILTYMRLYKIGDRVKIGDVTGDVVEKTLLVTRVRTIKNEVVSISNATIMNSQTVNYSLEATDRGLIVHTTVTIGYDAPWRQVHELLINAALDTPGVLKEPKPFVLQTSLDDFYVSYQVNAYTNEASKQAVIYSDLHQNIQDQFNKAGVEIMSPHYRHMRDGNETTIPREYQKRDK